MGLAISVAKSDTLDTNSIEKLAALCVVITQEKLHTVYVPRAGKLKDVLTILQANNLTYSLNQIDV